MCKERKQSYLQCCFVVMVQLCDSVGLSSYSHVGHQVYPQSVAFYGSVDCSEADRINLMWALCCKPPPTHAPKLPCDYTVSAVVHTHK